MATISIDVKSAGFNVGNTALFIVNGQPINMSYSRGLNVIVIDPSNSQIIRTQTFDTHGAQTEAEAFASLIENLPVGYIVGIAVLDEATNNLTDRAKRACEAIGSGLIYNLGYRGSWGLVGQKGAPIGSALEMLDNAQKVEFKAQQQLPEPEQIAYRVRLWSAGCDVGNSFWIEINAKRLDFSGDSRGLNVAVIDATTCQVLSQHNYDTHASTYASEQFADLIDSLPEGQFVAVAVKDEAFSSLTDRAKAAFESLGSRLIDQLQYRNSFAIFGQKGAVFGSASESLSSSMPVLCEAWLSPRPQGWEGWQGFSVSTLCASPSAGSACATFVDGIEVGSLSHATRGVLITIIDEKSGIKLLSANFDPGNDTSASESLANLIHSIPTGRIVVISTNMGAVSHLNDNALYACTLIGSAQIFTAKNDNNACWCIIGRKGSSMG